MGTSSSKSSSSQGSAPGVLEKERQTPRDILIYSLEDLKECDFKRFRGKLSDFSCGGKLPIPRGKLENADCTTTKDILIGTYGEEGALDVTNEVFTLIGLMGPANDLQERRAQIAKMTKLTHDKLSDFRKKHKVSMKEEFQKITEYNSCKGETVHLQKRYIKLSMRKGPQNEKGKEQELRSSGIRHLQTMEKRPSDGSSPTTIQALFDPDEFGCIPKIVVLEGPAGIGKTMTSKKIILDWASGNLYQDKFDFLFYLSCREINTIPENISLVGLVSRACRLESSNDLASLLEDPESQRKLLILVDGFDELSWTLEEKSEVCHDILKKKHKEIILQKLLRRQFLPHSSLIITTRSLAMGKLNTFIDDYRNVEIQGFTRDDREEYVRQFFGNKEDADKVLSIIKDNEVLYTMCAVPITCWIVCTVMKPEIEKDLGVIQCKTTTSIYLLYLEVLITHHSKEQSVRRKQTCLKKLCALANQGVLQHQILFEKKDLERHGLSLSEVESVFLNENIFHWDARTQTCYSFIHLSVQEFLAALYYGLDDGSMEGTFLPEICKRESLRHFSSDHSHLSLAAQFLFGLLNEDQVKTFSENTGINISLRARPAMIEWAKKYIDWKLYPRTFFYLYETQDKDFIRSVMSGFASLSLWGSLADDLLVKSNYPKQLSYCLNALKRETVQSLSFSLLTVDPECQKLLSPFLHRCQEVRFWDCNITSKYCPGEDRAEEEDKLSFYEEYKKYPADLSFLMNPESNIQTLRLNGCGLTSSRCDDLRSILITNPSLTCLDLSCNDLQDSGMRPLCEGLRHPGCTLQELRLQKCDLTSSCCDDLRSILITNRSLINLDLSFNDLQNSGMRPLCEGLRHPDCTLQKLRLERCNLTSSCCDDLHSILITNRSLINLDVSYNNLQDSGMRHLCEGLRHPGCTLQELRLYMCNLTSSCCDDLRSILITNRSLTSLDLSGNELQDSGMKRLCEGLRHPGCTLQELRLYMCYLTSSCCDDLRSILITNRSLTCLDLSRNDLQDSGMRRLYEGLRHPGCTLQHLRLERCNLTSSCCDDLLSILITNRSLTCLDLSKNDLQDSGMRCLCEGLRHPGCTLQELRIEECKMTLSCCDDICSMISTNRTLTNMEVKLEEKKMSYSEVGRSCQVLRNAGFTVNGGSLGGWLLGWNVSIHRRRLENGLLEVLPSSSADDSTD